MTEPSTGAGGTAVGITIGDRVMVGPFEVRQFRDTHMPGPQDHGDTAMLSRHESVGAISADLSLLMPYSPALPGIARWLADNPDGAVELWAHLDDLGEEQETPRLRSLRDALGDALSTDGGA